MVLGQRAARVEEVNGRGLTRLRVHAIVLEIGEQVRPSVEPRESHRIEGGTVGGG
jgi:hypothetical protein